MEGPKPSAPSAPEIVVEAEVINDVCAVEVPPQKDESLTIRGRTTADDRRWAVPRSETGLFNVLVFVSVGILLGLVYGKYHGDSNVLLYRPVRYCLAIVIVTTVLYFVHALIEMVQDEVLRATFETAVVVDPADEDKVMNEVFSEIRAAAAQIELRAEGYRVERTTRGSAERVVTCTRTAVVEIASLEDKSPPPPRLGAAKACGMLVRFETVAEAADPETARDLKRRIDEFRAANAGIGDNVEFAEVVERAGAPTHILFARKGALQSYLGCGAYLLAVILFVPWPYRKIIRHNLDIKTYTMRVKVSSTTTAISL